MSARGCGPGSPRRFTRRRLLALAAMGALAASGAAGLRNADRVETTWHRRALPGLPAGAPPLRVAHLTDLHCGPLVDEAFVRSAAVAAQAARPDVVLLTGDFISARPDFAESCARALEVLRAPGGLWGVWGNHDRRMPDLERVERALGTAGVRIVTNRSARLASGVWVVGIDDRVTGEPDVGAALADVPPGAPVLAMAHHPRTFDDLPARPLAMHAGHLHGGQINFPGRRAMMHATIGYAWGWYERGDASMYVSRGVGYTLLRYRVLAPPEVAIVDYMPAPHGAERGPAAAQSRRLERV